MVDALRIYLLRTGRVCFNPPKFPRCSKANNVHLTRFRAIKIKPWCFFVVVVIVMWLPRRQKLWRYEGANILLMAGLRLWDVSLIFVVFRVARRLKDHDPMVEPVIVLGCGHAYTLSTLDGYLDLASVYIKVCNACALAFDITLGEKSGGGCVGGEGLLHRGSLERGILY